MRAKLTYAALIVPVVGIIAMAALFGKLGVRPRALSVIKPSGFVGGQEVGYWIARQTHQKLFRNNFVLFGVDPNAPESFNVLEGFLDSSRTNGRGYDVVVSNQNRNFENVLNVSVGEKAGAEEILAAARPFLLGEKKVIVVLQNVNTSKLVRSSIARKFEFELGQKSAAISILQQSSADVSLLQDSDFCSDSDKLSFEKAETLRCLFLPLVLKFSREAQKSTKPVLAAVDQYGLDDYFVYLFQR